MPDPVTSRRSVLAAGAAGLAATALTGCGSDDSGPDGGEGGASDGVLAETSEVPEGGGVILDEPQVVLTQPAPGRFRAFSSTCTHKGCTVESVSEGTINCACHGSRFNITDGSVASGPAARPLPPVPITIDGDTIRLA